MTASAFVKIAEKKLRSLKSKSTQSADYHGTKLEYLGLKTEEIRGLSRTLDKDLYIPWRDAVKVLWKLPLHEARSLAVSLAVRHQKEFEKSDWTLFVKWLESSEGWAMIDGITCELFASVIEKYPPLALKTRPWSRSKNLWLRRASLSTFTRPIRSGQFADVAFAHAERLVSDPDPMIYKALSWLLRSSIKHDRKRIEKFLKTYENELHSSVLREVRTKLRTGKKNG